MPVPTSAIPPTGTDGAVLDTDRLDVYRIAVEFSAFASRLRVTPAALRDQLDRAAAAIVLNLAEGVGRASAPDRAHFFAISRGSALESAVVLDALYARGALSAESHGEGRALLVRVVQMMTRLIQRQAVTQRALPRQPRL